MRSFLCVGASCFKPLHGQILVKIFAEIVFLALQHTLISSSDSDEAEGDEGAQSSENIELLEDVIKPLSKLKVDGGNHDSKISFKI